MIFPCEKAVWHYLPQIRADLAITLVKNGMSQSQAAKKLDVTPAAISQYIHKKRGMQSPKSEAYHAEILAAVQQICAGTTPVTLHRMVCNCCQIMQKEANEAEVLCSASSSAPSSIVQQ